MCKYLGFLYHYNMNDFKFPDKYGEAKAYFTETDAPAGYAENVILLNNFVNQLDSDQRVVLVTAGGTKVLLERNTVRFIDNFSTGKR